MNAARKYGPFFVSALLMYVVLFVIYPHYQYYIDPDGTAYLTISQRYANGDYLRAINGYWSPWACWLTALLIKTGVAAIPASVLVNSAAATGFLYISQSFFLCFAIEKKFQWLLNVALALFLCFAVFWQSFDDLWECFFLLGTLRLLLTKDFVSKPALWVLYGFVGALAYFAKAYSFPFFILNTVCCVYFLSADNKLKWIKISLASVCVMMVLALPWVWLLHGKYGIWTTSVAGTLNTSWYLVGHPYWKEGINILLPPAYPDSPYYWEDPWFVNGATPHFWNSWHLFGLQFLRIGLNIWKFIVSNLQLSVFFIAIVGYAKWMLIWQRKTELAKDMRVLMLSFLLFTIGYLLVNYESRYLWYMVPPAMVIGARYIQQLKQKELKRVLPFLFAVSFLVYPALQMRSMYNEGKDEYDMAMQMKHMDLKGSYTVYPQHVSASSIERLAYFSGMQYYSIPLPGSRSFDEVLRDMNRYHVNYLIKYGNNSEVRLPDGRVLTDVAHGSINGLSIFSVNP